MRYITNAILTLPDHFVPDGVIAVENGRIFALGEARDFDIPSGAETFDAMGAFAGPGLIDIHTHAGGGTYIHENPRYALHTLLQHGVTGVLPALYFGMTQAQYLRALDAIDAADAPSLIGYYMEGPYMNPSFGCNREENPWRGPIRREDYLPIVERAGRKALVWVLAPEREGIEGFMRDALDANPNALFSVGHSEATPYEVEKLIPLGLRLATHHTNATGSLPKYPECRGVCVDEAVSNNPDIYAELIADSRGIHVDPYMLRLVLRVKGKDRVILISDAFVDDGPIPPGYDGVTDINFDHSGEISGSKMTLDAACRNMMKHTGGSLCDAFRYASRNPAKLLGLTDRGELRVGARADIVLTDGWMNVNRVFLKGDIVK